jgi:AcrR family transcriptional regulator
LTRVVKNPTVRREEIINIAEHLFIKKGYERTSVSDIVKKAKVAQGTFYYYFQSKDQVLDAITDRFVNDIHALLKKTSRNTKMNAIEKTLNLFQNLSMYGKNREKIIQYLHQEKNAHLHFKLEKKILPKLSPMFQRIIEQGVNEGVFNTKHPGEAANVILTSTQSIFEGKHLLTSDRKPKRKTVEAIFDITERILGAKPGVFLKVVQQIGGI